MENAVIASKVTWWLIPAYYIDTLSTVFFENFATVSFIDNVLIIRNKYASKLFSLTLIISFAPFFHQGNNLISNGSQPLYYTTTCVIWDQNF